jgi:choline/glycine/proline betaine transport protein
VKQDSGPGHRAIAADPVIFGVSAVVVSAILAFALAWTDRAQALFLGLQDWIVTYLGWVFAFSVTFFLGFAVWVACSRHGRVRLGRDDERPEFGTLTWFAMLFSAGMGIGMLFYGVAEPVLHYAHPPGGEADPHLAARSALRLAVFHWGLHAWGIYAVLGLALAYFHFRRGAPLSIRSALRPILGRWTDHWSGKLIDVLAVFGTLFGLATSLGLGAIQINAGISHLFGIPRSTGVQIALIAGITGCATLSLVSGLSRGIRRLSELNMLLAAALLLFVFACGPTAFLLRTLPDLLGSYVERLPELSLRTRPFGDVEWQKSWTLFYWAWWISWAPFVGTFVARISRGRTVREFVAGVLLVPTLVTVVWFGVLGGSALHEELFGGGGIAQAVDSDVAIALFDLLSRFPFYQVSSALAVLVIGTFFVTSSDSASFVVDMLTSGGNPDPPIWQRIFWALAEGAVAAVLLLTGGLVALQSAAINTGLPFCLVLVAICVSLARTLRREDDRGVYAAAPARSGETSPTATTQS